MDANLLSKALEISFDPFWITQSDGYFLYVNDAFSKLTGYSKEEFKRLHVSDIVANETLNDVIKHMQEIKEKGKTIFEAIYKTKDGRHLIVEVSTTYDSENDVYYSAGRDLTDKVKQLILLRESESKFKALFNNEHVVMLIIDPETAQIIDANPAASRFYGYSIEELKNKRITDINTISPSELDAEIKKAVALNKIQFQFKHQLANGEIRDVEVSSGPIVIEQKKYLYSIIKDITERKQTERRLAQSEAMHKAIFDARFSGIMIHDHGTILECNNGLSHLSGYSREELIGMNGFLLMSPEYRPIAQQAVRQGIEVPYLLKALKKNGETYWVTVEAKQFEMDGKQVRLVEFRDITAQKEAQQKLAESERKFRLLTENMNDVVWIWSVDKNAFTYVSPTIQKLRGISVEKALSEKMEDVMTPESAKDFQEKLAEHLPQFLHDPNYENHSISLIQQYHASGKLIWVEISSQFQKNEKEEVEIVGISRDVTKRKENEEQIQQLIQEKEIILKEVHHRVKNNMNTIYSLLVLQAAHLMNTTSEQPLHDTANRVRVMLSLYDKLYKTENLKQMLANDYFPDVIEQIKTIFPTQPNITINYSFDECIVQAKILASLGIIINELITNSVKYAFAGRDTGLIEITLKENQQEFLFTFKDDGIGFPQGFNLIQSKGFGMQLIQLMTAQIGGKLSVLPHSGVGFEIRFPK